MISILALVLAKSFRPAIFQFCTPPVINDQSLIIHHTLRPCRPRYFDVQMTADSTAVNSQYEPGDHLQVFPGNRRRDVLMVLSKLNVETYQYTAPLLLEVYGMCSCSYSVLTDIPIDNVTYILEYLLSLSQLSTCRGGLDRVGEVKKSPVDF